MPEPTNAHDTTTPDDRYADAQTRYADLGLDTPPAAGAAF